MTCNTGVVQVLKLTNVMSEYILAQFFLVFFVPVQPDWLVLKQALGPGAAGAAVRPVSPPDLSAG